MTEAFTQQPESWISQICHMQTQFYQHLVCCENRGKICTAIHWEFASFQPVEGERSPFISLDPPPFCTQWIAPLQAGCDSTTNTSHRCQSCAHDACHLVTPASFLKFLLHLWTLIYSLLLRWVRKIKKTFYGNWHTLFLCDPCGNCHRQSQDSYRQVLHWGSATVPCRVDIISNW